MRVGRRRSQPMAIAPVKIGKEARIIEAWLAEVSRTPNVNSIGNATKPQKADSRSSPCSRRCAGQRTFSASATGTASAPPRNVRRTATVNGEKSATATFDATGEAPHRTTAAKAARMTTGDIGLGLWGRD